MNRLFSCCSPARLLGLLFESLRVWVFAIAGCVALMASARAQLDVIHWIPPAVSDTIGAGANNLDDQFVVITTPSTTAVPVKITDGAGNLILNTTVSNGSPVNFKVGELSDGDHVPTVAGTTSNIIDYSKFNTIVSDGLKVTADEPVFVNIRQRSGAQGASLTSKGCAALGTGFRAGLMRERENFGTEDYRNHFISVMATQDDTVVTFSDFAPGVVVSGGTPTTEPPASGNPKTTDLIQVTLDEGESYAIGIHMDYYRDDGATASINDLNGTHIGSTNPIVVNTGTFLGSPNSAGARDAGFDQIAPTARAGTEYIMILGGGAATSVLESPTVVAIEDNTFVFVNGDLTPVNATPLSAGDYLYLDGRWDANGIMYVETSEPAMLYATTAGSNSAATPGFSFIPPLDADIYTEVNNIAQVNQIGSAIVRTVTTTGSTVTFNGNPPANGPIAISGNPNWVAYTQANMTGNVAVKSTGPVAVSVQNFHNPVGAQGYFSGFPVLLPHRKRTLW